MLQTRIEMLLDGIDDCHEVASRETEADIMSAIMAEEQLLRDTLVTLGVTPVAMPLA